MDPNQILLIALHTNDVENLNRALIGGADVNQIYNQGYSLLHTAVDRGLVGIVEIVCTNDNVSIDATTDFGMSALSLAISFGQETIVKLLLDSGANPNRLVVFNQSPVHLAAFYENTKILRMLIRNGAEVNTVDCFNQSPLCISILLKPNRKVTKMLLEAGADPNFKSKICLLAEAILSINIFKHFNVIKTLIDYGAKVNEKDEINEETPLHKAAAVGHCPITIYLVENGADFSIKNVYGQTPYDVAKSHFHDDICEVLAFVEDAGIVKELAELEDSRLVFQ